MAEQVNVKRAGSNPYGLEDGELLLIADGPHKGKSASVRVLFPEMNGGLPSAVLTLGRTSYQLDAENRCWRHMVAEEPHG